MWQNYSVNLRLVRDDTITPWFTSDFRLPTSD